MANIKITDLTSGSALIGTELFEAVQTGTSVKLTADQIKTYTLTGQAFGTFYDTTDQTASANTATLVKFNTTGSSSGVSVGNDGSGNPTKIIFAGAGTYYVSTILQFANSAVANNNLRIWWRKNNLDVTASSGIANVPKVADGGVTVCQLDFVFTLVAADYLSVAWATAATTTTLDYTAAITSPYAAPAVPSASFVAFRIK